MPPRHSSHRLEDRSRLKFGALLPDAWVMRSKVPDYGVDAEVEIFKDDGTATGLIFNVQLRATADARKARKMSMDVVQMDYFVSLDSPTAIVRYCQATGEFFWAWHFDRLPNETQRRAKSFTLSFSEADRWEAPTSEVIVKSLTMKRRVAALAPGARVTLQRPMPGGDLHQRFAVEGAVDRLIRALPWLAEPDPGETALLTLLGPDGAGPLDLRIGPLGHVSVLAPAPSPEPLFGQLLYGLADLFRRIGLTSHAADFARQALMDGLSHADRDLAASACLALAKEPMAMARLAILNSLPTIHDTAFMMVIVAMIGGSQPGPDRLDAGVAIFDCAAAFAKGQTDPAAKAAMLYSRGNFYANCEEPRRAFRSFRAAMKLWPAYMAKPYFRVELGDVLYELGRYRTALDLYLSLPDPKSLKFQWRIADVLFFSGRVGDAARRYHAIKEIDQPFDGLMEAEVKSWVCDWLITRHGQVAPHAKSDADRMVAGIDDAEGAAALFADIVHRIDALHALANFNVAVKRAGEKAYEDAWGGFMVSALSHPGDTGAWVSALQCAMNIREPSIATATLGVASHLGGPSVYERFRAAGLDQGFPAEAIEALDEMARSLKPGTSKNERELTLRLNRI